METLGPGGTLAAKGPEGWTAARREGSALRDVDLIHAAHEESPRGKTSSPSGCRRCPRPRAARRALPLMEGTWRRWAPSCRTGARSGRDHAVLPRGVFRPWLTADTLPGASGDGPGTRGSIPLGCPRPWASEWAAMDGPALLGENAPSPPWGFARDRKGKEAPRRYGWGGPDSLVWAGDAPTVPRHIDMAIAERRAFEYTRLSLPVGVSHTASFQAPGQGGFRAPSSSSWTKSTWSRPRSPAGEEEEEKLLYLVAKLGAQDGAGGPG